MRVLFVYTDFPWPPTRGNRVRALSQLEALSSLTEVASVRLFSLHEDAVTSEARAALGRAVPKLDVADPVYHPVHLFRDPRYVPRVLWLRARGVPYLAGKWEAPGVRRALEAEMRDRPYDVVWLGALGLARYLPLVREIRPSAKVVIDTHNVDSDIWAQYASRQRGPKRIVAAAEWRAARRFEREALRAADGVATISEEDARGLRAIAGVDPVYVPQIAPAEPRMRPAATGPRVLYVGYLGWHPNLLGLDWFFAEVWPRVRERLPDATLDVAGPGLASDRAGRPVAPPRWRGPGVGVLGFVADLSALYDRSAVLVAPILEGSGVRMKLVEAFRNGVPVVTTPQGAAGLPIESGREAFIERDAASFADRVVEVARSAALQDRLRASAYVFLSRHHSRETANSAMRRLLSGAGLSSELEVDEGLPAVRRDN